MKKSKFITPTLLIFLLIPQSFALECPPKDKAPLCPQSGTALLDETYPTQAFVISNDPFIQTKEARGVTRKFISRIIESYDYENVPQIMISVENSSEFENFREYTKAMLTAKKLPAEKIEKILGQLTHVPEKNFTWQQDWFESFVDLKTGSPEIRQIESYSRVSPKNGQSLSNAGISCQIQNGDSIKTDLPQSYTIDPRLKNQSFGSGEMGGNIEGAPGGFCLSGDNQGKRFTEQFCGSPDNIIQLQTSWLSVGHVDEIFKIIPTQFNDGRPKECEFSLMAASPKTALDILKNPNNSKSPFIDLTNPDVDPTEARETRTHVALAGNYHICQYAESIMKNKPNMIDSKPAVKAVFLKLAFGSNAFAKDPRFEAKSLFTDEFNNDELVVTANENCSKNIDQVTNFEIQAMMVEDQSFMELNTTIQESITKDKELIKNKILSRLPQCAAYYNELDVPNIFYGTPPMVALDGTLSLPRPGDINSFLPNPTNSVLMNKTVTFPNTGNFAFNSYLSDEMKKKKMKADFISSWDYAHLGKGNIHCASHSIPYCRPNTAGSK